MRDKIKSLLLDSIQTKQKTLELCLGDIEAAAHTCINALRNHHTIFFCGNGGSAADSQHLSAELVVRFKKNRKALAGISLTTDTSALTATGNDFGFEYIFSRQLEALAKRDDVLIMISTGGKSPNIVEALKKAKEMGVKTIGFTSERGKDFAKQCDVAICIPSPITARIQEGHACVGHILCDIIEETLC